MRDLTRAQLKDIITGKGLTDGDVHTVEEDLRLGAEHIEKVGWTRGRHFLDASRWRITPCCALGAVRAIARTQSETLGVVTRATNTMIRCHHANQIFEALQEEGMAEMNDQPSMTAEVMVAAMRQVAARLNAYMTGDDLHA